MTCYVKYDYHDIPGYCLFSVKNFHKSLHVLTLYGLYVKRVEECLLTIKLTVKLYSKEKK